MGRRGISISLSAVLAAPLALGGCAMSSTYGTGEVPEVALFHELTGGLVGSKKKPIDYEPRAPLVMPPNSQQLPPPVDTASLATPDWPVDPADSAAPGPTKDDNPYDDVTRKDYERTRSLAAVMDANADHARESNAKQSDHDDRDEYYRLLHHGGGQRDAFAKAVADSKGYNSTDRRYLTDPPLTYRQPADTAPTGEVDKGVKKHHFWSFLFSKS
jgi:hypothetical protein